MTVYRLTQSQGIEDAQVGWNLNTLVQKAEAVLDGSLIVLETAEEDEDEGYKGWQ